MALSVVRTVLLTVNSMQVLFNDDVDTNVGVGNVSVISEISSIPDPDIISVSTEGDLVTITYRPLFPDVQYKVTFFSTTSQSFQTINGEVITEDGNRNSFFITSPGDEDNPIRDEMVEDIGTLLKADEPSFVRDIVTSHANQFQRMSDNTQTVRSANYVSVLVEDEEVTRDDGPIDRLENGGTYEIVRAGANPTSSAVAATLEFNSTRSATFAVTTDRILNSVVETLPSDPVSLQSVDVVNERITDDIALNNNFVGLTIKAANSPVIQVVSVTLVRGTTSTEYDINRFGYTLVDNRYDTTAGSINVNLATNEIELSTSSLTGDSTGFLLPRAGDEIRISYVYKRLGRQVTASSVALTRIRQATRETVPAILNTFSLDNAPIVTSADVIATSGGVSFLNTSSVSGQQAFTTIHPAFTIEIPFDITRLPARAGEYTVNYTTGEVVVFGIDTENDGSGPNPPVATYSYRQVFVSGLDFTFDSDIDELAANSFRGVSGIDAKILFDIEDVFAAGEDFRVLSHVEALNERVNNEVIGDFTVRTSNFPVTDVFRILNETTGELYTTTRFNDTSVTFSGRRAPRQRDITRERAMFARVPQEVLLIADELTSSRSLRVFKVNLANNGVGDSQGRFIGANFDTSVLFSEASLFVREFFYEDKLFTSVTTNIDRLLVVGDYMVDYTNGIVYVAVSATQGTSIGDISYQHQEIETRNAHILGVNNIYRSSSALLPNVVTFGIGTITDTTVVPTGLEQVGERFVNDSVARVLVVGTHRSGENGVVTASSTTFVANSGNFTAADIGRTLRVGSSSQTPVQDVEITAIVSTKEVLVTPAFGATATGRVWVVIDLSEGAPKTLTLNHDIVSVLNIYPVNQLGSLPAVDLDGYFDIDVDSVSGNIITLGATNGLSVGDAVIVSYNFGDVFVDYRHVQDEIVISYEYGENSLDWSISDALSAGSTYFVTYKYGALRESLLANFGSLTQISELTTFSPNLNRETYRDIVGGTLQSFIEGPTIPSIERLVEAFTGVTPNITEFALSNWVLGRDALHLRDLVASSDVTFDLGKFDNGALMDSGTIAVPALAHLKLDEGTLEAWVRPTWKGLSNDSTLTFDLQVDGYADTSKIFIGFAANNPTAIPFSLNINDTTSVLAEPNNIDTETGYFIWFDEFTDAWQIRWRENRNEVHEFSGTIDSTGEFYNVVKPVGTDGYDINEITDVITSTIQQITLVAFVDGYDAAVNTSTFALDGLSFASGDFHYIFDMASRTDANRMSLFKDGTGFLNFQVFDNSRTFSDNAGFFNMSTNIKSWLPNELHHVAISWRFNSIDERDEMHLFVDGAEAPNLFKYGGNPKASSSFDFGDVGEETIILSASRPIVGGADGASTSGSILFRSVGIDLEARGVLVGDTLNLLDATGDGTSAPNSGLAYTVTGVGGNTVTLDRALTLTLSSLNFSINQITATMTTEINFQDIIVVAIDADGTETELNGVAATSPDYSIRRGSDSSHVITITNGVSRSDDVVLKPLGLIFKRCRDRIFVYGSTDEIRTKGAPPVSLADVKITPIILDRTLISTGGGFGLIGTVIGAQLVTLLQSFFASPCQPSNNSAGRKLAITLTGDNINYSIPGNQVIIAGATNSGAVQETVLFTENDTIVTSEFWTAISSITISVIPIDATQPVGVIEIKENNSITVSENNGDFAEVVDYANGIFTLQTFGTGGQDYLLNPCLYELDYPSFLRITLSDIADTFSVGSDSSGTSKFDGVIDELRILDTMSADTRIGESLASGARSITTDFNDSTASVTNNNTLLLAHLDNDVVDSSKFIDRFDSGFRVAPSVNSDFGTSAVFDNSRPFTVNNAGSVFNPDEGTIEFWVSPLDDSKGDPNLHYYVDMSSVIIEDKESVTSISVITNNRIREVESVRLASDTFNVGTNYFTGGSVSNLDNKTISLGTPLPGQNVQVKITYVPLSSQGDRVSIFRDKVGFINFFVRASGIDHMITVPMTWDRHTWHRIMVMWSTNSTNNQDRLRLFVDGSERGTIKYGTGLLYGTGIIYGQAEIRAGVNRFLVDNIDLTDTFSRIFVGTDVLSVNSARARIDNLRFSNIQRLQSIRLTTNDTIDINWNSNTDAAIPVVEDLDTTAIYNFDTIGVEVEFLATVINAERGIFRFEVEVIDSFDRVIGNSQLENLLIELINTIKPAHTEAIIRFVE